MREGAQLREIPIATRRAAYSKLQRAEDQGRLSPEDAARWSAARKDSKGRSQVFFLREWCAGRVKIKAVVREAVRRSAEQESNTSWIWANRQELLLHYSTEGKQGGEEYVDMLLRCAVKSRRHPMGPPLDRQWLVHLTSMEARRRAVCVCLLWGFRPSRASVRAFVAAVGGV